MIKSISFKNYRSFKTKQTINIKPITILVGPNSSGKSSILKLFGLIKQSIFTDFSPFINFKGKEVDLGSLKDVLHKQKADELEFSIECPLFFPSKETDKQMDDTEFNNDLVVTNNSLKYNLHINQLKKKSMKKVITGTHPWSQFNQKTRDRWRSFHDTGMIGNTNIGIYDKDNKLLDSKEFNRVGSHISGRKNLFTLRGYRSRYESNEIAMIRTKVKERLSTYLKVLQKINNNYNSRTINKAIDEIIWFWNYEKWFEGKSFFPETYLERGNRRYDSIELSVRPTPIHEYLDWEKPPIEKYWDYQENWKYSGDDIFDAEESLKHNENEDDENEDDENEKLIKIVLKRIKEHWMEINSSGLLDKREYYEYIEQTIFWYINDLIINCLQGTPSVLKPNIKSIVSMDTPERTNVYCHVVSSSIDIAFSNLTTIDALRPSPKPYYTFDEMKSIIGEEEVKTIINRKNSEDEYRYKISEKYLSILGFNHHVIVGQIDKEGELFSISLRNRKDNLSMTVDKFGFGFSQILPLVFARSRNGHLILIEQPELHLHPKSQSRLADFFVYRIGTTLSDIKTWATEYYVENQLKSWLENRFLIETHSEHLIRRLQVLIARGELSNEDVAIYYVDKNRLGNSFVKEYKINERGFFDEAWPEGFFDNISNSLMELWKTR